MTLPGSRTVSYTYDPVTADLETVTDWSNAPGPTTYNWNDDGRLATISRPTSTDPILSEYGYDTAGRLTGIPHSQGATYLAEYGYELDENGNRDQVVITGTEVLNGTETYVYDRLDRLVSASYPGPISASFEYDKNGNRTEVQSAGITTTYAYDEFGQLTDIDDDAGTPVDITIEYDDNGNRKQVIDNTGPTITREYTYDWANRLTLADVNSVSSTYEYLGDNTRASLDDGTQTDFLYDRLGGLPQVVDDGSNAYLHDVTGNSVSIDGATEDATYPLADALGSTRLITDDEGTALGDTNWDAWGNEQSTSGDQYEFGWTGQQYDESGNLVYLRARYYSPGTANFLSRDTVQPNAPGSGGYNPYSYANGNPTTFTDPSGRKASRSDFGGGVAGAFLYMAYIIDCHLFGDCGYKGGNIDNTDSDMVGGTVSPRQWIKWALSWGVNTINDYYPNWRVGAYFPDFGIPITWPCIYPCQTDKLVPHFPEAPKVGVDGRCYGASLVGPGICYQAYACLVVDSHETRGLMLTIALLGELVVSLVGGNLSMGIMQSNADSIFDLRGGSSYAEVGTVLPGGLTFGVSLARINGELIVTTSESFGFGSEFGAGSGASYSWVWELDDVRDWVELVVDL